MEPLNWLKILNLVKYKFQIIYASSMSLPLPLYLNIILRTLPLENLNYFRRISLVILVIVVKYIFSRFFFKIVF